jgi:hypothetical protein
MTLIAIGTLLQACGKGDSTGPNTVPATPVGEYTLNLIEQKAMPYTWYADTGYTLEVVSGSISIKANGKWVSKIVSKETVAGFASTYSDSTFGTWTGANGSASLTNAESSSISAATWTKNDVTVTDVDGTVTRKILYRKN